MIFEWVLHAKFHSDFIVNAFALVFLNYTARLHMIQFSANFT